MYQIAICDNDRQALDELRTGVQFWLSAHHEVNGIITAFEDSVQLRARLESEQFDLMLLDIMMPEIDGIEMGSFVRKKNRNTKIIYVTSSTEYAFDAYAVSALGYLTKPYREELLFEVLNTAYTLYEANARPTAVINGKDGIHRVACSDVMYVENDVREMVYRMRDGNKIMCVHRNSSFETAVVETFCSADCFVQPHKSYIVNMEYIQTLLTDYMLLDDGTKIPITRRRLADVRNAYLDYVSREVRL